MRQRLHQEAMAATKIQQWWQCILAQVYFIRLRASVPLVQSLERRRVALQASRKRKNAVIVLQGQWRICAARRLRTQLANDLERRVRESNASELIQGLLVKHLMVLRHQHVECESLMIEDILSDEEEEEDLVAQTSLPAGSDPVSISTTSETASAALDAAPTQDTDSNQELVPARDIDSQPSASLEPKEDARPPTPSAESVSVSVYRAAQLRRRAQKQASSQDDTGARRSKSCASSSRNSRAVKGKKKSIAHDYLPTKKSYWHYDSRKLQLVPVLQRWAKRQLKIKRTTLAIVKIQSAWRIYRAQSQLISAYLMRQW